jgi:hypothetical protein
MSFICNAFKMTTYEYKSRLVQTHKDVQEYTLMELHAYEQQW